MRYTILLVGMIATGCTAVLNDLSAPACSMNSECDVLNEMEAIAPDACERWQCSFLRAVCVKEARDDDHDGAVALRCASSPSAAGHPVDCNDDDPMIAPGAHEACDGVDQNCDGTIDDGCLCTPEGSTQPCGVSAVGACQFGIRTCTMTGWTECVGNIDPAPMEACDGIEDENCNGTVDEGCTCNEGDARACGVGACVGVQRCVSNAWTACDGAPPGPELCDGMDTDCDGADDASDTDVMGAGLVCGRTVGICHAGTQTCIGATLVCGGALYVPPGTEACNHLDDDCDGFIDAGLGPAPCSGTGPPGAAVIGTSGGSAPLPSYADWSGDLGRSNRYSVNNVAVGGSSAAAHGTLSLVVSPNRSVGLDADGGLPLLATAEHGLAAVVNFASGTGTISLVELDVSGAHVRASASIGTACGAPVSPTPTRRVTLSLDIDAPTLIARLESASGCGPVEVRFDAPTFWADYYGESASYPTYYPGVVLDDDGNLSLLYAQVTYERRTGTGDRPNCVSCP